MKDLARLGFALTVATWTALAGDFPTITLAELKQAVAEKRVALIDVNGTLVWDQGHIPGAIGFLNDQERLAEKLPADKGALVVAYCLDEGCAAYRAGAKAARRLGYTDVRHFPGGITAWKNAGERTEK